MADLAKMPHLLVAGTTGSGKSVGLNTMILSLLYRMSPQQCRLIMIDPKMLELSVYDGIPHLLSPVVTDPRKAVVALKWAVREMEDRYRKMSKMGVRGVEAFNDRVRKAKDKGEVLKRTVQTGFDRETGKPIYEDENLEFEAHALHRGGGGRSRRPDDDLGQGNRRRGAAPGPDGARRRHPSDRRHPAPVGGRDHRHHQGQLPHPHFLPGDAARSTAAPSWANRAPSSCWARATCSIWRRAGASSASTVPSSPTMKSKTWCASSSRQGAPEYLDAVTEEPDEESDDPYALMGGGNGESGDDLYDKALAVVARDKKASTSYIQRRLQIGYNRAASLIERMEQEGVVSSPNHKGVREVLLPDHDR